MPATVLDSPIGRILITADDTAITGVLLEPFPEPTEPANAVCREAVRQLNEYFAGGRKDFDLPLNLSGTPFQKKVWAELSRIPHGSTISYAELAARVGNPAASRAVGSANGKNPVWLVVPCHRVIAADGTLGGYGGGLDRKAWLLKHEGIEQFATA